jgi:hypothetical protein
MRSREWIFAGLNSTGVIHTWVSFQLKSMESGTLIQFNHHAVGSVDDQWELKYRHEWQHLLLIPRRLVEEGQAAGIVRDPSLGEP